MERIPVAMTALALLAVGVTTLQAQKPVRPTPTLVGTPGTANRPAATTTPPAGGKSARPTPTLVGTPQAGPPPAESVQTQAARPGAPATAVFTAGLAIESWDATEEPSVYARRFVRQLDSAIATLVGVFRNTAGQPLSGAAAPTALSQRERDRWGRCRDLHWDLLSFTAAAHDLPDAFAEVPALQRPAAALDSALTTQVATGECDNVASIVEAPDRWTPWEQHYETSARRFYTEWYPQVRAVHDRNRALVVALNGIAAPDERIPVPPALPRTAPYAGAGVR